MRAQQVHDEGTVEVIPTPELLNDTLKHLDNKDRVITLVKHEVLIIKYGGLTFKLCPINPYQRKSDGVIHDSNIRIFPVGGGLTSGGLPRVRKNFNLRVAGPNGEAENYDSRILTSCIELEPVDEVVETKE